MPMASFLLGLKLEDQYAQGAMNVIDMIREGVMLGWKVNRAG